MEESELLVKMIVMRPQRLLHMYWHRQDTQNLVEEEVREDAGMVERQLLAEQRHQAELEGLQPYFFSQLL